MHVTIATNEFDLAVLSLQGTQFVLHIPSQPDATHKLANTLHKMQYHNQNPPLYSSNPVTLAAFSSTLFLSASRTRRLLLVLS